MLRASAPAPGNFHGSAEMKAVFFEIVKNYDWKEAVTDLPIQFQEVLQIRVFLYTIQNRAVPTSGREKEKRCKKFFSYHKYTQISGHFFQKSKPEIIGK